MKIAYFVNSFNAINWGGQATSNGIKYQVEKTYKDAEFIALNLPPLPFRKLKLLRKFYENGLYKAMMNDDLEKIYKYLKYYSIDKEYFKEYTHICFNGEGAIHTKSGHLIFLMALLYMAKKQNIYVAAINQTIDLKASKKLEDLVRKIYNMVDFVSVREPVSKEYADSIDIKNVNLIPDAAYGIPYLSQDEIEKRIENYDLPKEFIGFAGSSALKRDKKSLAVVSRVLKILEAKFDIPIIFFANAKTDIWIAHKLEKEFNYRIIEPPVKYLDAIAIISQCKLLIGGRQHPNIFAFEYGRKYLPFGANTLKNKGVAKLQNYPLEPLAWDVEESVLLEQIDRVLEMEIDFTKVEINNFKIFGEI